MKTRLVVIAVAALAFACGGPKAGDTCSPEGGLACEDTTTVLECHGAVLRQVPCRGTGGCVADSSRASCDNSSAARAGDNCAFAQEGGAQCDSADANKALQCTSGVWQSHDCKGCLVQGGQVKCLE